MLTQSPKPKWVLNWTSVRQFTSPESNKGSGSTIAYIVAAIVLLAGAYLLYTNNMNTTTVVPSVTQNNTTITPDPVEPAPATPPAMEHTTPPAPVPATPPATEPVAP